MQSLEGTKVCPVCHGKQEEYNPSASSLMPGTCLAGRYFLGSVLGKGGFGITYIAWDVILEIPVAVKEYYPERIVGRDIVNNTHTLVQVYEEGAREEFQKGLRSFLHEARMMSCMLQLKGVVSVRDFFQENNTAYIVMEYIDGISMKEYIHAKGKMGAGEVLQMMEPIFLALKRMHDTGIIHRDISADNLMFTKEGEVKLIDFGTARKEEVVKQTITVSIKRGFSPQEQYRTRGEQGPWTDIYSLCATIYFMVTGEVPEESVERMVQDKIVPLEKRMDVALTAEQKKALDRGMAVMEEERWQDIADIYPQLYQGKQLKNISDVSVLKQKNTFPQKKFPERKPISKTVIRRELGDVFRKPENEKKQRRYRFGVLLGGILGCGILFGGIWFLGKGEPVPQADVSENVGKQVIIKEQEIEEQEPKPTFNVSKSQSPEKSKVPDMIGMTYKKAARLLEKEEFKAKRVWVQSEKKRGTVVRQSVMAGKQKKKGSSISLYVSEGLPKTSTQQSPAKKKEDDSSGSLDNYIN